MHAARLREVNSMSRRRIRQDRIPRGTITIKLDVDLIEWLEKYDNRSEVIESAVRDKKRTGMSHRLDDPWYVIDPQSDDRMQPIAGVGHATRMMHYVSEYERHGIRPKTTRFLKYELKQWIAAVREFEDGGSSE